MNKRIHYSFHLFLTLLCLSFTLNARPVETFYGTIEVEEPVLLELIDSQAFQRLKNIHQYGIGYYTDFREEYNRYDHSIGVFALLRANNASLEEQIAGLLHDVSHTAFSHVGDWIFHKENQEKDYQNDIHLEFLKRSGLAEILEKYDVSAEQILPLEELFPALEKSLPDLCADRIDYNIQGAYYQGFITYEEALEIFKDLDFVGTGWISKNPDLMKKLTRSSLFLTLNCWGSPINYVNSRWLADALLRGIEIGCLTYDDLHFGTDQVIWDRLLLQNDPVIAQTMHRILNYHNYITLVDSYGEADLVIKSKFRGINPWVETDSFCARITAFDEKLAEEYEAAKRLTENGWPIKFAQEFAY